MTKLILTVASEGTRTFSERLALRFKKGTTRKQAFEYAQGCAEDWCKDINCESNEIIADLENGTVIATCYRGDTYVSRMYRVKGAN